MQARAPQHYTGRVLQGFLADMVASTRASVETLKERLRRTTMRERILLGGLAMIFYPLAHWMHEKEGKWWPWPKHKKKK